MAEQIRELDRAAEQASTAIAASAAQLSAGTAGPSSATRADLLAGLGAALVERTEEIREDCRRLSELMSRTAKLVAERDARPEEPASPPALEVAPPPAETKAAAPIADVATDVVTGESAHGDLFPRNDLFRARDDRDPLVDRRADASDRRHPRAVSEGVRLIATQMAIAGSTRIEIERRLQSQFGVRDADVALDDIFGTPQNEVR